MAVTSYGDITPRLLAWVGARGAPTGLTRMESAQWLRTFRKAERRLGIKVPLKHGGFGRPRATRG